MGMELSIPSFTPIRPMLTTFIPKPGFFTVNLAVLTSDSCENNISQDVTVATAPIAEFFFYDHTCGAMPVQFTDNSAPNGGNSIMQWYWDFGD